MEQLTIRLTKELKDQLKKLAEEENRSINYLINSILEKEIKKSDV